MNAATSGALLLRALKPSEAGKGSTLSDDEKSVLEGFKNYKKQ